MMQQFIYLIFGAWLGLLPSLFAQTVTITNPGLTVLTDAVVEIPWATIQKAYPQVDTAQLILSTDGREVPYQLETKGEKTIQNLLVQISLGPKKSQQLALRRGKPTPIAPKTYCRYVPERYDDFAWENDRVAFRIYGHALNGRFDNAYGTDIWAKRTDALIVNKWYSQNDYHKDHGEGLDYYHVGLTLGAGDIGVWLKDSIRYIHNYHTWNILDNGPLRSTFRVTYDPYTFDGIRVHMTKTISLDAGSQLSRVVVAVTHTAKADLPMVAGITLRPSTSPLLLDEETGVLGYWEPAHGEDGILGVGCVFTTAPVPMLRQYEHGLAKLRVKSGGTLVYYTGGAWNKAGRISTSDAWFAYLHQYAIQQKQRPIVSVSNGAGKR